MERINAIYARQSVDRPDSISIESQIEFCKFELKGGTFKEYKDKGYSGKNTLRPQLQQLLQDIRRGEIAKVVVYKLDRISRSILDFTNMMELFQEYQVEFVSSTEKFDTSTPMGRAMLNICIVFAQLERETIQKRVSDAYYSRSQKGFHMGGKPPYGFRLEETVLQGIHTKKLVQIPEQAKFVKQIFEMYAKPETSYGDITRYFTEQKVQFYGKELIRPMVAQMLRNPVYVKADKDIYRFFKSQGTMVVSCEEEFDGIHGCYLYQGKEEKQDKLQCLKGQMLVVAPHEGMISSELWLKCRIKIFGNMTLKVNRRAVNTWLAGKIKCGYCGYAMLSVKSRSGRGYLRCMKRLNNKGCDGCGKIYTADVELYVYLRMVGKLREHQTPVGYTEAHQNPRWKALAEEAEELEQEIIRLVDSLSGAGDALTSYINQRVSKLDQIRQEKMTQMIKMADQMVIPAHIDRIVASITDWEHTSFADKQFVVDALIDCVHVKKDGIEITWKLFGEK